MTILTEHPSARPRLVPGTAGERAVGRPVRAGIGTSGVRSQDLASRNAVRLRALRRAGIAQAASRRSGPILVGLYVLVDERQLPRERLVVAQAMAERSRWDVRERACDTTGWTDPATRPQLARLHAALIRGEIHGIVAASRTDISPADQQFEAELLLLHSWGGFLGLARDEVQL